MAPETDRWNAALAQHLRQLPRAQWDAYMVAQLAHPDTSRWDFIHNLDTTLDALNALGLEWAYMPGYHSVHVMDRWDVGGEPPRRVATGHLRDTSPRAFATALVQAALTLLGEEEATE